MHLVVSEPFDMDGRVFVRGQHIEDAETVERIERGPQAVFVRRAADPEPAKEG